MQPFSIKKKERNHENTPIYDKLKENKMSLE